MTINIPALLDKAKVIHSLPSDYKLALIMGVNLTSLANYRNGKTLPDARVIRQICNLTGDDPAVLVAEIEAERAKTSDARELWQQVAERLRLVPAAALAASSLIAGNAGATSAGAVFSAYSLVDSCLHTAGVAGSNPASPTT